MKRKRMLLILGCLAAVLLAGYGTLRLTVPGPHRINLDNILSLRPAMTEGQIEEILGARAGVFSSHGRTGFYFIEDVANDLEIMKTGLELIQEKAGKEWVADDFTVYVRFDGAGRAQEILQGYLDNSEPTLLAKLRRWLGM
jgi:hypothetical protein